jgi:hypothetical protein
MYLAYNIFISVQLTQLGAHEIRRMRKMIGIILNNAKELRIKEREGIQ